MFSCKLRAATEGGRPSNLGAVPPLAEVGRCAFACVPAIHDPLLCTPSAGMPPPDGGLSASPAQGTIAWLQLDDLYCASELLLSPTTPALKRAMRWQPRRHLPDLSSIQASQCCCLYAPGNVVRAVPGAGTCAASAGAAFASPAMPTAAVRHSCALFRILTSRVGFAGGGAERDKDGLRGLTGRSALRRWCTSWRL